MPNLFELGTQSWYRLERQEAPFLDATGEAPVDCGWVEQMLPFIECLCPLQGVVLDPFAGWGSSLVAAARLKRRSIGAEIEPARCEAILARLQAEGQSPLGSVLCCDSAHLPLAPGSVDLVVGSVPYFGYWRDQPDGSGQCYRAADYAAYLALMDGIVAELARVIRPSGYCVLVAENLWLDGVFVPLAWDVARLMAKHLQLGEERLLCYPGRERAGASGDILRSNRAHEYAFIARPHSHP